MLDPIKANVEFVLAENESLTARWMAGEEKLRNVLIGKVIQHSRGSIHANDVLAILDTISPTPLPIPKVVRPSPEPVKGRPYSYVLVCSQESDEGARVGGYSIWAQGIPAESPELIELLISQKSWGYLHGS